MYAVVYRFVMALVWALAAFGAQKIIATLFGHAHAYRGAQGFLDSRGKRANGLAQLISQAFIARFLRDTQGLLGQGICDFLVKTGAHRGLPRVFRQAPLHIGLNHVDHGVHLCLFIFKEVTRPLHLLMGDGDAFLLVQLIDQNTGVLGFGHAVGGAVHDQT